MIEIRPATRRDVTYVAVNMRAQDEREVLGILPDWMAPGQAGLLCFEATPEEFRWVAHKDGQPICAFGVAPQSDFTPWLWSAWAFGTPGMKRVIPAISRFVLKVWPRALIDAGASRVEIRSLADHDIAHLWLASLGARREGLCRTYGRGGDDYELWACLKEDFDNVFHESTEAACSTNAAGNT